MNEEIGRFVIRISLIKQETQNAINMTVVNDNLISDSEIIIALETIAKDMRKQKENLYEQSKYQMHE